MAEDGLKRYRDVFFCDAWSHVIGSLSSLRQDTALFAESHVRYCKQDAGAAWDLSGRMVIKQRLCSVSHRVLRGRAAVGSHVSKLEDFWSNY
jgi:hypothetical protein